MADEMKPMGDDADEASKMPGDDSAKDDSANEGSDDASESKEEGM